MWHRLERNISHLHAKPTERTHFTETLELQLQSNTDGYTAIRVIMLTLSATLLNYI